MYTATWSYYVYCSQLCTVSKYSPSLRICCYYGWNHVYLYAQIIMIMIIMILSAYSCLVFSPFWMAFCRPKIHKFQNFLFDAFQWIELKIINFQDCIQNGQRAHYRKAFAIKSGRYLEDKIQICCAITVDTDLPHRPNFQVTSHNSSPRYNWHF